MSDIHQSNIRQQPLFKSRDVEKLTGIPYRTLLRFIERGGIFPQKISSEKESDTFYWSAVDIYWATIGRQLLRYGFSVGRIRQVLDHLQNCGEDVFSHEDVFVEDDKFLLVQNRIGGYVRILDPYELPLMCHHLEQGEGCFLMRIEVLELFTRKLLFEKASLK